MTIKQIGGIFGRNPTFNDVTIDGQLTFEGDIDINSDLKVDGNLVVDGNGEFDSLDVVANGIKANANAAIGFQLGGDASGSTDIGKIVNNAGRFAIEPAGNRRFVVRTNSTKVDALEVDHNNNVSVPNGNVVMGNGQGIDFSATSGTGTSELFDDYEEGTWTPTTASDASGAFSTAEGVYTKIGRLVFIEMYVVISSNFASNTIGGLPFAVGNLLAGTSFGQSGVVLTNAADTVTGAAQETTSNIRLYNDHNALSAHSPNTTNDGYRLALCYQV